MSNQPLLLLPQGRPPYKYYIHHATVALSVKIVVVVVVVFTLTTVCEDYVCMYVCIVIKYSRVHV